jgi:hypothetical protein
MSYRSPKYFPKLVYLLVFLVGASLLLLFGYSWGSGDHRGRSAAQRFLTEAQAAFQSGNDEVGVTFLSAALVADPTNEDGLNLYQDRLERRFQDAVSANDWQLAQTQIAGYDSAIRAGLKETKTNAEVHSLIERQKRLAEWEAGLQYKRDAFATDEAQSVLIALATADRAAAHDLEGRLRALPIDALGEKAKEKVALAASQLMQKQQKLLTDELDKALHEFCTFPKNLIPTGEIA